MKSDTQKMPKNFRVCMTILGRKGGMDRIANLTSETIKEHPELGIHVIQLLTRGRGNIFFGSFIFAFAFVRFWVAALQGKVDLLHLNVAAGGSAYRKLILARVARRFNIPYVVHLHGSRFHEFYSSLSRRPRRAVDQLFLESAKIIVLGQYWAQFIGDALPTVQGKISILHNATRRVSIISDREHQSEACVNISCLGELGTRKGTPQLIEALGCLAELSGWKATIAGNGDITGSRAQSEKLGISDRVSIPGWVSPEKTELILYQTDILVLPSFAENLPMAILEGFAHGVAVISTPVGAIPEVIDHERNGLIVPTGDVNALAAAIRRLIDDPDLRRKLGTAARRDHADRYDINVYVPRLAAIWREAYNGPNFLTDPKSRPHVTAN
jgi:glycosyltransferase involved in cell wall biosynthesis